MRNLLIVVHIWLTQGEEEKPKDVLINPVISKIKS